METKTNPMEALLQMIDPEHGIILDENIGLIGKYSSADTKQKTIAHKSELISVGKLWDKPSMVKRGDYYVPIGTCGILFDEHVADTGIMYSSNKIFGYAFILKDYKAVQVFDKFFDSECECNAVVLYINSKLYINCVNDDEIKSKFEYEPSIRIEFIKQGEYKLWFRDKLFYSYRIEANNNISIFKNVEMQL